MFNSFESPFNINICAKYHLQASFNSVNLSILCVISQSALPFDCNLCH